MKLWLQVTSDKYELPMIVADSPAELAKLAHVEKRTVITLNSKYKNGRRKKPKYISVEVEV